MKPGEPDALGLCWNISVPAVETPGATVDCVIAHDHTV